MKFELLITKFKIELNMISILLHLHLSFLKKLRSQSFGYSLEFLSSADNLAANFSRELADYIIYIIDVSGGDKIPRKGGPGITQADLLVSATCMALAL